MKRGKMKFFKFMFGMIICLLIFGMVILPQSRQIIAKEKIIDIDASKKIDEILDWFRDVYLEQQIKIEEAFKKIKDLSPDKKDKVKSKKEMESILTNKELVKLNKLTWEYTNINVPKALIKIETLCFKQEEKIAKLEYLLAKEKAKNSRKNMTGQVKEKKESYKKAKKEYKEFLKKARSAD